ncbi:hypothetical protein [Vibrio ponticus]|nr:hypothetical protein [Vibrio ponticus]
MRFYKNQHNYYCGIDLHARLLYVCILDSLAASLVRIHNNEQQSCLHLG